MVKSKGKIENKGDLIFTSVLLMMCGFFLFSTLGYRKVSRIFPLVVLIPTVTLLIAQTLGFFNKRLRLILEGLSTLSFGEDKEDLACQPKVQTSKKDEVISVFMWMAYGLLTYLLGFEVASPIFVFFIIRFYAKMSLKFSVLLGIGVFVFLRGMFVYFLGVGLYGGEIYYYF